MMNHMPTPEPLAYETRGKGEPLVFLHGFGATRATWNRLAAQLENEYQLFLLDLKGFGASPEPHDDKYSIRDHAEAVCSFLIAHNLQDAVLVGNSLGGSVALFSAFLLREKGFRPRALVLIAPGAYHQKLPHYMHLLELPVIGRLMFFMPKRRLMNDVLHKMYYDPSKIGADEAGTYLAPFKRHDYPYVLRETVHQIVPRDAAYWESRYTSLDIPSLLIWGKQDQVISPKMGYRLVKALPHAKLLVFNRCGHAPQEEMPEETAKAIRELFKSLRGPLR